MSVTPAARGPVRAKVAGRASATRGRPGTLKLARGDIWLVRPDLPTGPAHPFVPDAVRVTVEATAFVVMSPAELNDHLRTVILAPVRLLPLHARPAAVDAPFRPSFRFEDAPASVALDQLRTVERHRLVKRVGRLSSTALKNSLSALQAMFAP